MKKPWRRSRLKPPSRPRRAPRGGYLEPIVLLEPPAHNPGCSCVIVDIQLGNVCLIFSCLRLVANPLDTLDPPAPPWNSWNIQPSQGTGQGVSMTFNAASRLRSLEDRSAALGQVAANCRVCIVSRNLQSCHTPLGSAA